MKRPLIVISAALATAAAPALWSPRVSGHTMSGPAMQDSDHAAMMAHCESMMGGRNTSMMQMPRRDASPASASAGTAAHAGSGVVREVDAARGRVTLAHDPIASLRWPAMTMTFVVKDKAILDKLAVDARVEVEFVQLGSDYVVIAVK
jgi:Cu(I)/Ag(I) efflux system periplasmic protein CusF